METASGFILMNTPADGDRGDQATLEQQLRGRTPDIESVHRDLAFANSYRLEFIKTLLLIAGALFAFSVSFRPELLTVNCENLFWIAWIGLGISMIGGFAQLAAWERLYSSYQRFEYRNKSGGPAFRKVITFGRRIALLCQVCGFVVGIASLGSFTAANLSNVEKKAQTARSQSSLQHLLSKGNVQVAS